MKYLKIIFQHNLTKNDVNASKKLRKIMILNNIKIRCEILLFARPS